MWRSLVLAWLSYFFWAVAIWAPWIPSKAVANTLLGLDMAEAVKFLPGVRAGHIHIWRESFLLPQLTLSAILALHAWQPRWPYPKWIRFSMQLVAFMTALSMLPPAWTPSLLRAPVWRTQTLFISLGVGLALLSPAARLFPIQLVDGFLALLGLGTATLLGGELQMLWPEFTAAYHHPLPFGVGIWALGLGTTVLLLLAALELKEK